MRCGPRSFEAQSYRRTAIRDDGRVADRIRAWRVDVERIAETETSVLVYGQSAHRPVVLKVIKEPGSEWRSGAVLAAFDGYGTVRVYEHTEGAMLLERAVPGHSLVRTVLEGRDDEATAVLAEVIAKMSPQPAPHGTPAVQEWGSAFTRYTASGDTRVPKRLVAQAEELYQALSSSQTEVRLLHGDLHHDNVILDHSREWLAIDPKGVVGELEYELGAALRNPYESPDVFTQPAIIRARVDRFVRELPVNTERVVAWALAQAVLAAIWTVEDGLHGEYRRGLISLARALTPMISLKRCGK